MKAVVCREFGPPEGLSVGTLPDPEPGAGEVLVEIEAASVNFADTLMVAGRYQLRPGLPFVPGLEFVGRVLACGAGAGRFAVGDRVAGAPPNGAFAERIACREELLYAMPDDMEPALGAGFLVGFGTAGYGLLARGGLQAGEAVLVTGAAGNVGRAVLQIAARTGARGIAAVGSADKARLARAAGAAETVDYTREGWQAEVKEMTGGGVEMVFDNVGGDAFDAALRATKPRARILTVGFASGRIPRIPAEYLMIKNLTVHGIGFGGIVQTDRAEAEAVLARLLELHAARPFTTPEARLIALDDVPDMLSRIAARRTLGAAIVTPSLKEAVLS